MLRRKFFFIFVLLAGLFAFQGSIAVPVPQDKVRTELVIAFRDQRVSVPVPNEGHHSIKFFVRDVFPESQVSVPHLLTLIISSIHHHSSL